MPRSSPPLHAALFAALLAPSLDARAAPLPDPDALAEGWARAEGEIRARGTLPLPPIEPTTWAALADGKVVKIRVPEPDGVDRAVGVGWAPHPLDEAWIAVLDDVHDTLVQGLTERNLAGSSPTLKILYQHLDLPAPFNDRHWVLNVQSTPGMAPWIWERSWDLDPRGPGALDDRPSDVTELEGIWTPQNEGGWWLIEAAGGTLLVYQVRSDIGGYIPDELVLRYAMSTLDEMMLHVDDRSDAIPGHYTAGHYEILKPDGHSIAPWPR